MSLRKRNDLGRATPGGAGVIWITSVIQHEQRRKGMLAPEHRFWVAFWLAIILLTVGYECAEQYLKSQARSKRRAAIELLRLVANYKHMTVMEHNMRFGDPFTRDDLKSWFPPATNTASLIFSDQPEQEAISQARNSDWLLFVEPVGEPARLRFIRELDGQAAGTEVTENAVE